MGRTLYRYALFLVLLVGLSLFLLWPIYLTVRGGLITDDGALTFEHILGVFSHHTLRQGLINSTLIAFSTTFICLLISLPLAHWATRYDFFGKTAITSLILVPLILPPFVGAIGLKALIGQTGAVNQILKNLHLIDANGPGIDFLGGALGGRFFSVVLMESLHLYPILYLNVAAAMANLDPTLDEAAMNLGASRWTRFRKLTLPLILPGIFAGGTIVLIWSFTELGTPLMFDFYEVTPVQIFFRINEISASPQPYALTVVMLGISVLMYLTGKLLFGRKAYAMESKASVGSSTIKLPFRKGIWITLAFVLVTGMAVMPHLGVILKSVEAEGTWYRTVMPQVYTSAHYEAALTHDLATTSIRNSLFLAFTAMIVAVIAGMAISYLVVRVKIKGGTLLDTLSMLPLAVPGLVMAFGYVAMSIQANAWIDSAVAAGNPGGAWVNFLEWVRPYASVEGDMPNPFVILIIAYAVRRLPYMVRSASAGLQQTSGSLEEAALNLGASQATAIRRIVIPLILANLIAGAILVFSFAMLEVSDSLILAKKAEHFPITKAIYEFFSRLGDGPHIASAMGVWGMALLTITLVGASVLMGKKLGAIFQA